MSVGTVVSRMERFGRWAVEQRLGAGGMGEVFLARDPGGSLAALKVVREEYASDPVFRARFRREVEACSRVRGPRVAELVDADTDSARPWLAVRYVPGPTLGAQVAHSGVLQNEHLRALAIGLADALTEIWAAGIVHRDLKPSNVILTPDGPILIDFGIATATEATAITRPGVAVGSAGWIAPEVLQGRTTTSRTDVWGWAAVTLFAATGAGPHGEGPADALAWRTLNSTLDPARLKDLPRPLPSLVARSLTVDPADRPDPQLLPALAAGQHVDEPTAVAETRPEREAVLTRLWDLPLAPTAMPEPPQRSQPPRRRLVGVAAATLAVAALAAAIVLASDRDGKQEAGRTTTTSVPETTAGDPGDTPSQADTQTTAATATAETTTTTGVTAERRSPDIVLFEEHLDGATPFYNDLLAYTGEGPIDQPEQEAALLGSWYALADWCNANGHGRIGICYDKAATFLNEYFDRDPRTLNTQSWGQPGAIGGVIATGYDLTNSHLGIDTQVMIPDLMQNRPGDAVLCEPSCSAVLD
jgi:eukaryotic-like serine/threonine-protein kinase